MNKNELFGDFMSAPTTSSITTPTLNQLAQSTDNFIIDNNTIYNKLISLEIEINNLKMLINNIKYPQPIYYPLQPQGIIQQPLQAIIQQPSQETIPQFWTTSTNAIWKDNQNKFYKI